MPTSANALTAHELGACDFQGKTSTVTGVSTDEVVRKNVQRLMHDRRLNGSQLAKRINKTASWASNYLVAKKGIPLETVDAIAAALRVSVASLVTPVADSHAQRSIDEQELVEQDYSSATTRHMEGTLTSEQEKTVLALWTLLPQADRASILTDMKHRVGRSFALDTASPKDHAMR